MICPGVDARTTEGQNFVRESRNMKNESEDDCVDSISSSDG